METKLAEKPEYDPRLPIISRGKRSRVIKKPNRIGRPTIKESEQIQKERDQKKREKDEKRKRIEKSNEVQKQKLDGYFTPKQTTKIE